jgi:hypothetical protein
MPPGPCRAPAVGPPRPAPPGDPAPTFPAPTHPAPTQFPRQTRLEFAGAPREDPASAKDLPRASRCARVQRLGHKCTKATAPVAQSGVVGQLRLRKRGEPRPPQRGRLGSAAAPHKAVHALSAANRDERNRTPTARPVHPGGGPLPMRPSATLPSQFVPTHGLWRNVRQPFKPGCNGDVVWQLILRGPFHKDRKQAVTRKFLKEGFAHCRNNPNAKLGHPVGRAGQYPSKCVKYGLFSPAGRDIWIRGPAFDDPRMNPDEL